MPFDGAVDRRAGGARRWPEHPEIDFVSLVHAEAATGNTNPVAEIGEVVRAHGALFMLDAVASVGAEPLLPDAWGVDLCVIGAPEGDGRAGRGVGGVGRATGPGSGSPPTRRRPRRSYLSLLDWKERWIDARPRGAAARPGAAGDAGAGRPAWTGSRPRGCRPVMARHARGRGGDPGGRAAAGGLAPYVTARRGRGAGGHDAPRPGGVTPWAGRPRRWRPTPAAAGRGGGALAKEMIRVNHYGRAASLDAVLTSLTALATALGTDPADALAAAEAAWSETLH